MRILKFGGKSLGSIEKMQNICKFIKKIYENDKKIIVVVSAMGKTTDELICRSKEFLGEHKAERELAVLLSTGETTCSALFSMMLISMGVPAESYQGFQLQTTTFGEYNNGCITYINKNQLIKCLNNSTVAVVSGFQGINSSGEITTLGRGGSDTTAAAIGAIFNTNAEIYSDFDGVFAGDPRELNYKKLKAVDYDSMIAMANGGAKVIDSRATTIAKNYGIELISKSSSSPKLIGTTISGLECDIVTLSSIDHLSLITIVISNPERFISVLNTTVKCLNDYKFYKFTAKPNKITFLISSTDRLNVVTSLSKKLKLTKNN